MLRKYILKEILHSGRKGIRGTDRTELKYKGLLGYQCFISSAQIRQFKPCKFDVNSPYYDWWRTSEVLAAKIYCNDDGTFLEIETVNTIYIFKEVTK